MGKRKIEDDTQFYGFVLNEGQRAFHDALFDQSKQVVICNATAGAGKTLIAVACARLLTYKKVYDDAVYVFPTVEEGTLGYRPGNVTDKEADYVQPLYDALTSMGEDPDHSIYNDVSLKNGTAWVEAKSATFLRGTNMKRKFLIIDEAQNFTAPQLKKIISRAHDDTKVVIIGCIAQMDIPLDRSGFAKTIAFLKPYDDRVQICEMPVSYRGWLAQTIDGL